jgi:hypothetical protein
MSIWSSLIPAKSPEEMRRVEVLTPLYDFVKSFWPKYTAAKVKEAEYADQDQCCGSGMRSDPWIRFQESQNIPNKEKLGIRELDESRILIK